MDMTPLVEEVETTGMLSGMHDKSTLRALGGALEVRLQQIAAEPGRRDTHAEDICPPIEDFLGYLRSEGLYD
jgi:hypothetical protein